MNKNYGLLDEETFIELFETYKAAIYRMAYFYTKNQSDALDMVQEVAYRAFRKRKTLKEFCYFKSWTLKITINASIDFLRKNKKVVEFPFQEEILTGQKEETYSDLYLNELLHALDQEEKTLIYLKYYQEYTFQEISEMLEFPISTVKSKIYRSLEKLRIHHQKEGLS